MRQLRDSTDTQTSATAEPSRLLPADRHTRTDQLTLNQTLLATGTVLALDENFTSTVLLPRPVSTPVSQAQAERPLNHASEPADLSDANALLSSRQDHIDTSVRPLSLASPTTLQLAEGATPPPVEALLDGADHSLAELLSRLTPASEPHLIIHAWQPSSDIMPIDLSAFAPLNSQDLHRLDLLNTLITDEDLPG